MLTFCELIDFMSNLWDILENKQANHAKMDHHGYYSLQVLNMGCNHKI